MSMISPCIVCHEVQLLISCINNKILKLKKYIYENFGVTAEYPATRTNFCVAGYAVRSD